MKSRGLKSLIALLLTVCLAVIATVVVVSAEGTAPVTNGGFVTDYGVIPEADYDPDNKPYAVFEKQTDGTYTYIATYESFGNDSTLTTSAFGSAIAYGDVVILLLRDATYEEASPLSNLLRAGGEILFDLGTHTLTDSHTHGYGMFTFFERSNSVDTSITVTNGTLLANSTKYVASVSANASYNVSVTLRFKDMTVGFAEGTAATAILPSYNANANEAGYYSVIFDNCTVDFTNAPSATVVYNNTTFVDVSLVNGTEVVGKSEEGYQNIAGDYGYDALVPETVYNAPQANPFIILEKTTYYHEGVPHAYKYFGAYTSLNAALTAAYETTSATNSVILMLTNFTETTGAYNNWSTYAKHNVVDLGGHTLTSAAQRIFTLYSFGTSKDSSLTVQNGTALLYQSGQMIGTLNHSNGNVNTNSVSLNFKDMTFGFAEGATATQLVLNQLGTGKVGVDGVKHYVTFDNCVFDFANAPASASKIYLVYNHSAATATVDELEFKVTNSEFRNTTAAVGYNLTREYGYADIPADGEYFAIYLNEGSGYAQSQNLVFYNDSWTFIDNAKTLFPDSNKGTSDTTCALFLAGWDGSAMRTASTIFLLDNYTDTSTSICTQIARNQNVTIDLNGFTIDATGITRGARQGWLGLYGRDGFATTINVTVKNGNIVLKDTPLFDGELAAKYTVNLTLEDLGVSYAAGSTASCVLGQGHVHVTRMNLNGCTVDLTNAPAGIVLQQDGAYSGKTTITLNDTEIVNTKVIEPQVNISLSDSVIFNVFVPSTAANANVTVKSVVLGGVVYSDLEAIKVGDYYKVSVSVAPNAALTADTLEVNVVYTYTYQDATTEETETALSWNISVASYLKQLVANSTNEAEVTLAKDLLAYIRAAYVYSNAADLDAALAYINGIIGEDYGTGDVTITGSDAVTDGMKVVQLSLSGKPAFVFTPADGYTIDDYTFAVNVDGKYYRLTAEQYGENELIVSVPAWAFDNDVEYILNGTETRGLFNLAAYYNAVKNAETPDQNLVVLIESLARYAQSAEAYRNSLVNN